MRSHIARRVVPGIGLYRGTSLIRNCTHLGPYSSLGLGAYGGPRGWGGFL